MGQAKTLVLNRNGRKIPTVRKSTAEIRLRMMWFTLRAIFDCLCQYGRYIWDHNPVNVLSRRHRRLYFVENYGEMIIKPKFRERILDLLLTDFRRRQILLNWVHGRVGSHAFVHDFSTCWQDGTVLCALLESICPGVCPSFHLLSGHNRVKNCRLGLKLANKYLYVPMDLISAEEFAIANKSTEQKIIQYISMVKWASDNIKEKWSTLHESLIAAKTGRCFAKGSGLKSGVVDKRSKFTILVSDTIGVFNLLIEVRGPNHEYCGERIVSLHQAKALLDKSLDYDVPESEHIKYLEDCAGNTFVRKKIPVRYGSTGEKIYLDVQCGEEGTFYVTFVPTRAGMHAVAIKWQNHHVDNSPFRIKVYKASNVSTKSMKGAQEKRVIYDSLSFSSHSAESLDQPDVHIPDEYGSQHGSDSNRSMSAIAKAKAYSKGRQLTVTRRRVLRRIITRNGEDIVIEEAISPSLSRQSSITDNSDDESRHQRMEDGGYVQVQALKSHPKVLGTVLEERQGSREGDATGHIGHNQLVATTTTKYKCTELDEHNRLDVDSMNHEHIGDHVTTDGSLHSTMTLFEKYAHDEAAGVSKQSVLKRTNTIHHPYKTVAHRTTSDDPIYKLRKGLVSFNHQDPSDTSSEISSEDLLRFADDENDPKIPTIKLLHSGSLKKACMYISEKAMTNTPQSSADVIDSASLEESSTPNAKTKLHATQSLPIMRRYWQRDLSDGNCVTGLINCLEKIELRQELQKEFQHDSNLCEDENHSCTNTEREEHNGMDTFSPCTKCDRQKNPVQVTPNEGIFNFNNVNQYEQTENVHHDTPTGQTMSGESGNNSLCMDTPNSAATMRANLTRQTPICCNKSSGDSSSVKTDRSTVSTDKDTISLSSSSKSRNYCAFKTIYVNSNSKETNKMLNDITIVIPQPTIDKSTQVTHDEIKKETGWEVIENAYLLLRRIRIQAPCFNNDATPATQASTIQHSTGQRGSPQDNISADKELLQVPHSPRSETEYPPRTRTHSPFFKSSLNQNGVTNGVDVSNIDNHGNINSWLERNYLLNRPNTIAPVRQYTMDTIDSGFDDNQSPIQTSRQGRLSLPAVLSENGHTRIYRRPYRGPKMPLDPSLVNSTSSHSVSLDKREAGNEADDELIRSGSPEDISKHQRRRLRRINREDSFSLSDSELNERCKRIRQRHHSFDHSSSNKSDSSFSFGPEKRRHNFSDAFKALLEDRSEKHEEEKSVEEAVNLSDDDNSDNASDRGAEKVSALPKYVKTRLQTLTSVDSNYHGFGLLNSTRQDFLSQLSAFQNICHTESTTEEETLESKITHGEDKSVVFQYTDIANSEDQATLDLNNHLLVECDSENDQGDTNVNETDVGNEFDRSLSETSDSLCKSVDLNFANEDHDSDSPKHTGCDENDIHSSTYFDIFSSFDHSDLPDYINPNDVAMLGDVISLTTNSGEQMIMRVAGAGLRHGTVGENNSFQVWVENPVVGSLSVIVTGPRSHSVTETSIVYTGDNLYEIAFEVADLGLYSIYINWGEFSIVKQPYICNVTM